MGYTCDFCGNQRSMVHCRSDAACLCLSCDQHVHGANTLAKRHCRTLLCERCNEQPAFIRCVEERISLCHNCDRMEHACSTSTSTHKRQSINSYSGCPTAAELSTIWSFFTDIPSVDDSNYEHGLDLMSIRKDSDEKGLPPPENNCKEDGAPAVELNDEQNAIKSSVWTGSCSMSQPNCMPDSVDQMAGFQHSDLHKLSWPGTKGLGPCEDDGLYEDFNIDEVDLDIENYEEIFGVALSHSELLLENGGINSLFGATSNSTCQGAVAAQETSDGMVNAMQPACSNVASVDSMVNSKMEPIHSHCFKTRPTHSALSFSGLTGESSAGDYQDCGASSMLLMGEPPWCPPCPESSFSSASRNSAVMRYQEKKKARKFEKKVRYASRKARADVRKRVKGRFVKAGDAYDYDPLTKPEAAEISVFNNN